MSGLDVLGLIREAAEAGDQFAQYELAMAYDYGSCGVGQDFGKASEWYGRAAKQGHQSAEINLLIWRKQHLSGVRFRVRQSIQADKFRHVHRIAQLRRASG